MRWKTAWITGASSGIGREIALQLARAGVRVAASARSGDALSALAAHSLGVTAYPLDVTDGAATARCACEVESAIGPLDLAVFAAGTLTEMRADAFSADTIANAMRVNVDGVCNGIAAVLPGMLARQSGHIVIVASVAGYRGLPGSAAYGPTKAALINLAETLAGELPQNGISVSIVNPGFVDTPMTQANTFPMPFMITAEDAARRTIAGLQKGRFEIAYPWPMVLGLKVARLLPYALFLPLSRRFLTRRGDKG